MPVAENKHESAVTDGQDPFLGILNNLKNKSKNLTARKKKLEVLKQLVDEGKEGELQPEQVQAIDKLPEVLIQLEQVTGLLERLQRSHELLERQQKQQRHQLRQQLQEREQHRLRRVLLIQEVLGRLNERVLADLASIAAADTTEGAQTPSGGRISQLALHQLQQLVALVTVSRANTNVPLKEQSAVASEHLLRLAEGSHKKVIGTTYDALAALVDTVGLLTLVDCPSHCRQQQQQEEELEGEREDEAEVCDVHTELVVTHCDELEAPLSEARAAPVVECVAPTDTLHNGGSEVQALSAPFCGAAEVGDCVPPARHSSVVTIEQLCQILPVQQMSSDIHFLQESELDVRDPASFDPAIVSCSMLPASYSSERPPSAPVPLTASQTFTTSALSPAQVHSTAGGDSAGLCQAALPCTTAVSAIPSASWADDVDLSGQAVSGTDAAAAIGGAAAAAAIGGGAAAAAIGGAAAAAMGGAAAGGGGGAAAAAATVAVVGGGGGAVNAWSKPHCYRTQQHEQQAPFSDAFSEPAPVPGVRDVCQVSAAHQSSDWTGSGRNLDYERRGGPRARGGGFHEGRHETSRNEFGAGVGRIAGARGARPYRGAGGGYGVGRRGNGVPAIGGYRRGPGERRGSAGGAAFRGGVARE